MTKFLPPPYIKQKCNTLHKLVQNNENAPDKQPNYLVQILGHAGTFIYIVDLYCLIHPKLIDVLSIRNG